MWRMKSFDFSKSKDALLNILPDTIHNSDYNIVSSDVVQSRSLAKIREL